MGWFSDLLRGGGGELGWDDLIRRVTEAVAALRRHAFPRRLPAREYMVSSADRTTVTATEPRMWQLAVAGGDLDGRALASRGDLVPAVVGAR